MARPSAVRSPARHVAARATVLAIAVSAAGCSGAADRPDLTLFVAASLTDAVREIGDTFSAAHDVDVVYNFAGSGALAQQILAAPRADLFLSASERWMDAVEAAGRLLPGTRATLLSNALVVIANPAADLGIGAPADLCRPTFTYLSIGDPESVPAGRYAQTWLRTVRCPHGGSAWDALAGRIAPAPDVRAALTQVQASTDVAGIVYRTDFLARRDEVRLVYEVPSAEGPAIRYPVALLVDGGAREAAERFLAHLGGGEARATFERHGFVVSPAG